MSSHREHKKRWYHAKSGWLKDQLGGRCGKCRVKRKRPLHFDVKVPVDNGHHHRKQGPCQRMRFYLAQFAAGNLQLRCNVCNGHKGATKDKAHYANMRNEQQSEPGGVPVSVDIEPIPF